MEIIVHINVIHCTAALNEHIIKCCNGALCAEKFKRPFICAVI